MEPRPVLRRLCGVEPKALELQIVVVTFRLVDGYLWKSKTMRHQESTVRYGARILVDVHSEPRLGR